MLSFLTENFIAHPNPFKGCAFTYVSLTLGLSYLFIFIFSIRLLFQLLKQFKRRPQKLFLSLLSIHSLLRSVYFISWPFVGNGCIPGLKASTHVLYLEILGTFPVCFFVASFSLYVLTIARVNTIFQLYFNRYSPKCIIWFYRILVALVVILNLSSTIFTIADVIVPEENKSLHDITFNGALFSITIGSLIVAFAFVYIVVSLYHTIEDEILAPQVQSQRSSQYSLDNSYDNTSMYNYTYDGDNDPIPPHLATNRYSNTSDHMNANSQVLHSSISATFSYTHARIQQQNQTQQQNLTQQQSTSFSYGYQGRLALNPQRNPMRHLYFVSVLSCVSLSIKSILLLCLNYFITFDPEKDQNSPSATIVLASYFILSELVPSVACLISFNVVAAPTSQWKYTYAQDDPTNAYSAQNRSDRNQDESSINHVGGYNAFESGRQSIGYHQAVDGLVQVRTQQRENQERLLQDDGILSTPQKQEYDYFRTTPAFPTSPMSPTPTKQTKRSSNNNNNMNNMNNENNHIYGLSPTGFDQSNDFNFLHSHESEGVMAKTPGVEGSIHHQNMMSSTLDPVYSRGNYNTNPSYNNYGQNDYHNNSRPNSVASPRIKQQMNAFSNVNKAGVRTMGVNLSESQLTPPPSVYISNPSSIADSSGQAHSKNAPRTPGRRRTGAGTANSVRK
jgi:hypothetical protein